jgi:hypothetical protein
MRDLIAPKVLGSQWLGAVRPPGQHLDHVARSDASPSASPPGRDPQIQAHTASPCRAIRADQPHRV